MRWGIRDHEKTYSGSRICNTDNYEIIESSVADPDPNPDPPDIRVFGPPGSGSVSTSQRYGSGSGSCSACESGSFYL